MQICFHSGHFRWFSHFSQFNEFICSAFKFYLDFIGFFFQSVCLKGFEGYWQGWWCGKCWPREDFAAVLTIGTIIPGPTPTNDTSTQLFSAKFPNTKLNKTYKSTLEQRPQYCNMSDLIGVRGLERGQLLSSWSLRCPPGGNPNHHPPGLKYSHLKIGLKTMQLQICWHFLFYPEEKMPLCWGFEYLTIFSQLHYTRCWTNRQ